jgi:hypothetical protein
MAAARRSSGTCSAVRISARVGSGMAHMSSLATAATQIVARTEEATVAHQQGQAKVDPAAC